MIVSLVLFQTNYNTILTQFIEMIYFKTYWFFCLLTKSLSGKYVFAAGKAAKTHTNVAINCTETKTDVMISCDLYRKISCLYCQGINLNLKFLKLIIHHIWLLLSSNLLRWNIWWPTSWLWSRMKNPWYSVCFSEQCSVYNAKAHALNLNKSYCFILESIIYRD